MSDTALRLASILEDEKMHSMAIDTEAAAELRRLVAENEALKAELAEQARVNGMGSEREAKMLALNAELVEALRRLIDMDVAYRRGPVVEEAVEKSRAALAKAGVGK